MNVTNGRKKTTNSKKRSTSKSSSVYIPKHMSKKSKQNLKRNLRTLGEKKYNVFSFSGVVDDQGQILDISAIGQGTTDLLRDGDQIGIRSIEVNAQAFMYAPVVSGDLTNIVRLVVFQWFPTSTPVPSSIFNTTMTTALAPIVAYNHDNRFNFRILYDKKFVLSRNGAAVVYHRKYILKGFREKIQYSAGTTTGSNKIYACFISDSGAADHPSLAATFKINFSDY